MLMIVGLVLYPYHSLDLGILFFSIFGLSTSEAGGIAMFVTPAVLLLALVTSIGYGMYFLFKRKEIWQFITELIISIFALLQLPAY